MRIGILCTDSVREELRPKWGDYPQMFADLFGRGGEPGPGVSAYDAQLMSFPEPEACDAYVITGSRRSVYDDEPWIDPLVEFVKAALAAERRIVGICFGHQLMAHFFGGGVVAAEAGWEVGVCGAEILSREAWMQPSARHVDLVAVHQDQVAELPRNARLFLGSESCPNAGFVVGERVLTFQCHPEFTRPYAEALIHLRREVFEDEAFERAIASLVQETDEHLVAKWILNFLEGGGS